jgi:hypothetical protein
MSNILSADEGGAIYNIVNGGIDFGLQFKVLAFQIHHLEVMHNTFFKRVQTYDFCRLYLPAIF